MAFFEGSKIGYEKVQFLIYNLKKIEFISYENLILIVIIGSFLLKNLYTVFYQIWQSIFVLRIEKYLASELFKSYLNRNMNFFSSQLLLNGYKVNDLSYSII